MPRPSKPAASPSAQPPAGAGTAAATIAATPMAFVRALLTAYAQQGRAPDAALAQARITPAQLADDSARITAGQFEALSSHAMQELDDEALGWFSRRLPWGSYGLLCRASVTAPTLGIALARWCRHHRLLTDDVLLHLDTTGPAARLWIEERRDLGPLREFCLVTLLRYVHGFACWAIDSRIGLREAAFPLAAPPHADVYPLLFPGPVRFGTATAGWAVDADYLQLPLVRDEAAMRAMLQRALPLTVRQYRRDRLLVTRVRALLQEQPARPHTAEDVASALHLSVRTLHRQLKSEGATLQQLKDTVRRELATALLHGGDRPVKQVAQAVGFRNEKSFSRAFKGWTGQAPGGLARRSHGDDAGGPPPAAA